MGIGDGLRVTNIEYKVGVRARWGRGPSGGRGRTGPLHLAPFMQLGLMPSRLVPAPFR